MLLDTLHKTSSCLPYSVLSELRIFFSSWNIKYWCDSTRDCNTFLVKSVVYSPAISLVLTIHISFSFGLSNSKYLKTEKHSVFRAILLLLSFYKVPGNQPKYKKNGWSVEEWKSYGYHIFCWLCDQNLSVTFVKLPIRGRNDLMCRFPQLLERNKVTRGILLDTSWRWHWLIPPLRISLFLYRNHPIVVAIIEPQVVVPSFLPCILKLYTLFEQDYFSSVKRVKAQKQPFTTLGTIPFYLVIFLVVTCDILRITRVFLSNNGFFMKIF